MRVRTRDGNLEVAVDTYRHRSTGRKVVLVGMVHAADAKFFTWVQAFVAEMERRGCAVHYERITKPDLGDATATERDLLRRISAVGSHKLIADLVGLGMQTQCLRYRRHWRNTDMDALALLRAMPDRETWLAGMEKAAAAVVKLSGDDLANAKSVIGWVLRHLPLVIRWNAVRHPLRDRAASRVLVDQRNAIAVQAAVTETRNVVALWGAAHLPGIGRGLEEAGFRRVKTKWLVAIRKPRPRHGRKVPTLVPVADIGGWDNADGGAA